MVSPMRSNNAAPSALMCLMNSRLLCSDSLYIYFRFDCMKGLSLVTRTMATARIRVMTPRVR